MFTKNVGLGDISESESKAGSCQSVLFTTLYIAFPDYSEQCARRDLPGTKELDDPSLVQCYVFGSRLKKKDGRNGS